MASRNPVHLQPLTKTDDLTSQICPTDISHLTSSFAITKITKIQSQNWINWTFYSQNINQKCIQKDEPLTVIKQSKIHACSKLLSLANRRVTRSFNMAKSLKDIKQTSSINKIFGTYILSGLLCSQCEEERYQLEILTSLALSINNSSITDVNSALKYYTLPEEMDVDINCFDCNMACKTVKQIKLFDMPPIVVIQIKLYKTHSSKYTKYIEINDTLDLSGVYVGEKPLPDYDLYAITIHDGRSLTSGHYYSACWVGNQWWEFNDMSVSPIDDIKSYLLKRKGNYGTITPRQSSHLDI